MHVMIDLETLGVGQRAVILSIGAALWNPETGVVSDFTFHIGLEVEEQLAKGRKIDASTFGWWMQQSDEARTAIVTRVAKSPREALMIFSKWFGDMEGAEVWGHGCGFDINLMESLYADYGMIPPWKYNKVRDTRTLFAAAGKKMGDFRTPNVLAHDALQDAIYQAHETAKCLSYLEACVASGT